MTKYTFALLTAALLGGCASAPPSLYERVAARLAARGDLATLGQTPPQLAQLDWLRGDWTVAVTVFATAATPERHERGTSTATTLLDGRWLQIADSYPHGTRNVSWISYNLVERCWVSTGIDGAGNAVASTGTAQGETLVFETRDARIMGEALTLRQTLRKLSADEYTIVNEEQLHGVWRPLDEYHYHRVTNP